MRNLKRALSLLLSSTMVLGMVVMGGSAAGYQDVDDTYHKEAIEVLQAAGIMTGVDSAGNFNPEGTVTRNEMAVIMSNLMAYNVATYSGTSPFTDVPDWAEPYVAACWTNGITAGTSETTYGGDQTVTTAQAALMIMKALGYFQYQSDFGSDWQLSTVSQGNKIDLFTDVNSGVKEAMTRNDVAQLVLNGLESGTVQAETSGTITVGDITIVNDVKYNLITSGEKYAFAINDALTTSNDGTVSTGSIVELGEKLYLGDLAKKRDVDDFGRPSNVWSYNSNEIGTYADEATYTHNTKVTSKALYNEVGSIAASDYKWHVTYNGVETSYTGADLVANKTENDTDFVAKALGGTARTGTGVLTEVYVNNVDKEVYVAIVDTFVGEVTKVEDDAVTIKQFDNGNSQHPDLDSKKFETTDSGLAVGDIVLYTVSGKEIMSLQKAESVTGTLTAYQAKDPGSSDTNANKDSYAKLDDTQYTYAVQMAKNLEDNTDIYPMGLNNEYVFYLDTFGNLIAFKGVEVVDNYLYVENAVKSAAGVDAKVLFADGVEKVINVSKVKRSIDGATYETATDEGAYDTAANEVAIGGIYTYSEDNGLYRLTALEEISFDTGIDVREYADLAAHGGTAFNFTTPNANGEAYAIKQGHSRIYPVTAAAVSGGKVTSWTDNSATATSYAVDSTTIFVDVATGEVFTGYQNVPSYSAVNAKVAFGKNGVADVVFIYNQYEKSNSGVYFFVDGDSRETWETNDVTYRKYEVYINGEKQDLVTKDLTLTKNSVYKQIQVNADGQLIDADLVYSNSIITGVMGNVTGAHKATSIANNTLVLDAADATQGGKSIFNWDDETVFVNINTKYDSTGAVVVDTVEPGAATDIDVVNGTTAVYVISVNDKSNVAPTAKLVYIVTQPDADNLATVSFAGTTSEFQVNGSSPASISVVKGNNVTFTITGAVGYKVTGVSVNGTALTPDANTTNQYTLKNVNSNTTVTVATSADNSAKLDIAAPGQAATISVNGKIYANAAEIEGFENGEAVLVTIKFGASVPTNGQIVMYGDDVITAFSGNDYLINVDSSKQLKVGVATYTLDLPANVTATYTFKTVNGNATASNKTEIPEGATVTMTVDSGAKYYVNYGTEYKKANESFTDFEMTAPVTVSGDKYYNVTLTTDVGTTASNLNGNTVTAACAELAGGNFVKAGTLNITFTGVDGSTGNPNGDVKLQFTAATGAASGTYSSATKILDNASAASAQSIPGDTITISDDQAADITIAYDTVDG